MAEQNSSTSYAASLAQEIREMHAVIMAASGEEGHPQSVMLRYAMKDRIDRLCKALGVFDE